MALPLWNVPWYTGQGLWCGADKRVAMKKQQSVLCERSERRDSQRNHALVLQAAHELFAERGPDDVRMEEVAQRAGVGVGTIYRRFRSKEELFAAVSKAACSATHETLRAATTIVADPIAKLRALIVVQYQRNAEQAELLAVRQQANTHYTSGFDQQQLYQALHMLVMDTISEGQHAGLVRQGNPAILASLCLELLSPRTFQHLAQCGCSHADQLAEYTAEFILRALRID
jgi:AcrR family transcriptional regulator